MSEYGFEIKISLDSYETTYFFIYLFHFIGNFTVIAIGYTCKYANCYSAIRSS